jgi:predicted enzyme related to lactoylglutathione lyase
MLQGLRTICYPVADLAVGKAWYTEVAGKPPYFDEPFYVGFEINGFELGLIPDGQPGATGATTYWSVPDVAAELQRLLELGAILRDPVTDVGGGIQVASVLDPFGNVLGVIHVPAVHG